MENFDFPRDVLDEIWDFIESVSEGFSTFSFILAYMFLVNQEMIACLAYQALAFSVSLH